MKEVHCHGGNRSLELRLNSKVALALLQDDNESSVKTSTLSDSGIIQTVII